MKQTQLCTVYTKAKSEHINCVKANDGKGWMGLLKRYYLTLKSHKGSDEKT